MEKLPIISNHQLEIITGDIKGNTAKIISAIREDASQGVEISVFSETAISGYMCGALWDNEKFLGDQMEALYKIEEEFKNCNHRGIAILGFIDYPKNRKNGYPLLYNSAAILSPNEDISIYYKRILADSDHHEDKKYFAHGKQEKIVFEYNLPYAGKTRIGVPICEDLWHTDHVRNIPGDMIEKFGADILISINQSYFYYGKQRKRHNLLKGIATKYQIPVVYCNSIGLGDIVKNIVSFDGGSMIIERDGNLLYQARNFTQEHFICNNSSTTEFKEESKYKQITDCLIYEQKEFFRLSGVKKAQVHVSGGLDSAIVASLVQKSMGLKNTILITNPTDLNDRSKKYVDHLCNALDNPCYVQPLQKIYDTFMGLDSLSFHSELNDSGKASVQAVLRTVQGLAASHRFGSGIVATGNHTEIVLGWASFHDIGSIGVHSLIGDLTKMELFELADYINKEIYKKEVIPNNIFNGVFKPAAELPDAPGEDPIDYEIYSGICALLIRERLTIHQVAAYWGKSDRARRRGINENLDRLQRIEENILQYFPSLESILKYSFNEFEAHVIRAYQLMKRSVYKAAQGAPIVIISPRSRGFSNRETLINKYVEDEE